METHEETLELADVLAALRRRWLVIVGCTVIAAGAALGLSLAQTKQYEATAKLLFRDPGFDERVFGSPVLGSTDSDRAGQTNVELVSLDVIALRTSEALGQRSSATAISDKVAVQPEGGSDVVSLTATDSNPEYAALIANNFARQFIQFRREADRAKVAEARRLLEAEIDRLPPAEVAGAEDDALRDQLSALKTLEALQTGNAELVEEAVVPLGAASPKVTRNGIVAGIVGLLLGIGAALLLERFDRRVRTPEELEDELGMPLLSVVPFSAALAGEHGGPAQLSGFDEQAFRMLQTRLRYFNVDNELDSVLVTSAAIDEGKSTVSMHLALAAAASGSRVLLIDADMHHNRVAEALGLSAGPGLAEVLSNQAFAVTTMQRVTVPGADNGTAVGKPLDVLVSGETPPNPVALLESEQMAWHMERFRTDHDLVVVDSVPMAIVADAIPLVKMVSGVLIVARPGLSTTDSLAELRRQLDNLSAPTLGIVANAYQPRGTRYGYGYGYGLYGKASSRPAATPSSSPGAAEPTEPS